MVSIFVLGLVVGGGSYHLFVGRGLDRNLEELRKSHRETRTALSDSIAENRELESRIGELKERNDELEGELRSAKDSVDRVEGRAERLAEIIKEGEGYIGDSGDAIGEAEEILGAIRAQARRGADEAGQLARDIREADSQ